MPDPRNKAVFIAVAAVATALVVGLTVTERNSAVEARRAADQEREHADRQRADAERRLYVANMNLVLPAWEQNNLGRVRQLIEETAAYPQRGFEWYYWQRQAHRELMTLRGHLGEVLAVALSPDGQRIVTGSSDRTAQVWEAATPVQVARWQAEEQAAAERMAAERHRPIR